MELSCRYQMRVGRRRARSDGRGFTTRGRIATEDGEISRV
jgi:hypothetical protein